MYNFQSTKYPAHALYEAKRSIYLYCQDKETVAEYFKTFKNKIEVIEHNGGTFGMEPGIMEAFLKEEGLDNLTANNDQKVAAQAKTVESVMACAFILGADRNRYGKLIEDLENSCTQGTNKYPADLTTAYKLLVNWKQDPRNQIQVVRQASTNNSNNRPGELVFTNVGSTETGSHCLTTAGTTNTNATTGNEYPSIRCYNCQRMGHYASSCPNEAVTRSEDAVQLLNAAVEENEDESYSSEFSFLLGPEGKLPKWWILLDNQSTVNIVMNPKLLSNIRTVNRHINVHCNAGTATTNMIGDMKGFPGEVWCHPHGIANILSFTQVKKHFKITFDDNCFVVHKGDGTVRKFVESEQGLHFMDISKNKKSLDMENVTPIEAATFITTVADKKSNYAVKDYRNAELARRMQNLSLIHI